MTKAERNLLLRGDSEGWPAFSVSHLIANDENATVWVKALNPYIPLVA